MKNHRITAIRLLFLILLVAAFASAAYMRAKGEHFEAGEFRRWFAGFGDWAPFIFIAAYAALATVGFPGIILTTVGALVFGRGWGTILIVIGATLGASGAFWVARVLAHDFVARRLTGKKWYDDFNAGIEKNGFYYMLFIRLIPLMPFNGINFASGITKIRFSSYFFGTAIGIIPHAFVYANAVVELGESAAHGFALSPRLILAFSLLAFFGILPVLLKRYLDRRAT